jgi:hypothetical protein
MTIPSVLRYASARGILSNEGKIVMHICWIETPFIGRNTLSHLKNRKMV